MEQCYTPKSYSLLASCWTFLGFLVIFGEDKAMIKEKDPDTMYIVISDKRGI